MKQAAVAGVFAIVLVAAAGFAVMRGQRALPPIEVTLQPSILPADGESEAVLSIRGVSRNSPAVDLSDAHRARVLSSKRTASGWDCQIRAGVLPGLEEIRVRGKQVTLTLTRADRDSIGDGMPDFLRLRDSDVVAFRRWFTFLAESQYFNPVDKRPAEIVDCAALVRYAYREALRAHDEVWLSHSSLYLIPAFDSVRKYSYPFAPTGSGLFRNRDGEFTQFADAETLQRFNTYFVSRDLPRGRPGDLLFFRRAVGKMQFHTMIVLGRSQISGSAPGYLVYHSGPNGTGPGEVRRLEVSQLLNWPDPQFRPLPDNPVFLGVYRWNILHPIP